MPPIAKENETLTASADTVSRPTGNAVSVEASHKPQPVAVEVPVTVNGARTVEGSDKREPFSESTKTVLVFGSGAVIRLASSVAPGQLLFLTNEKTKKEVVCQVVKSKNYRNVSGYVELEFTEAVVGFWGMRFPGDRLAPASSSSLPQTFAPPSACSAPPVLRTVAPKVETSAPTVASILPAKPPVPPVSVVPATPRRIEEPAANKPVPPVAQITAPKSTSFDPEAALNAAPVQPDETVSPVFDLPRASDAPASIFAPPPQGPAVVSPIEPLSFSSVSDAKLAAPSVVHSSQAPVTTNAETEELKQHTARLQEQLSTMLFAEDAAPQPVVKFPDAKVIEPVMRADEPASILEIPKTEPLVKPAGMPKSTSLPAKSLLDDEEMQIPAWLEPLARNAAAPSSTQELIEREKSRRLAEQAKVEDVEEIAPETASPVQDEHVFELQAPAFGNTLSFEQNLSASESNAKSSGKGFKFAAIAATILLLVGGAWWYMRPQSDSVAASPTVPSKSQTQASASVVTVPADTLQAQSSKMLEVSSPLKGNPADHLNPSSQTKPAQNRAGLTTAGGTAAPSHNDKAPPSSPNANALAVTVASSQPAAAQPKKLALGEVRLATPTVRKKRGGAQDTAEQDATLALSSDQPESNSEALGTGLVANTKGPAAPAAPIPVGGDVKTARLITSVPPVYPALAKSQHVSGNVLVDALIDANGRVTTMKVVSGPTLLHQAAMDALKQWKYQPALLDGKPVPMHLTVTIQFRLQ